MSIESAKAFVERMKNDEDFRKKVGEIATAEERIEYVKGAGFDFTKDEIATLNDELSDSELDAVAGGAWRGFGDHTCKDNSAGDKMYD